MAENENFQYPQVGDEEYQVTGQSRTVESLEFNAVFFTVEIRECAKQKEEIH